MINTFRVFIVCFMCSFCIEFSLTCYTAQAKDPVVVNSESAEDYRKGLPLFEEGKYSEALSFFQKAYKQDKRNVAACFAIGLTLFKQNKFSALELHTEKTYRWESISVAVLTRSVEQPTRGGPKSHVLRSSLSAPSGPMILQRNPRRPMKKNPV